MIEKKEKKFEGIRPRRKEMDKWTKVPNEVFDKVMGELSHVEFKIYCAILRQTYGYKEKIVDNEIVYRIEDSISLSQFMKKTGISKSSISKSLKKLINKGYVVKTGDYDESTGKSATYALRQKTEVINPTYDENNEEKETRSSKKQGVSQENSNNDRDYRDNLTTRSSEKRGVSQKNPPRSSEEQPRSSKNPPRSSEEPQKKKNLNKDLKEKDLKDLNKNNKGENDIFEKSSLSKTTLQLFKEAFGDYPNSIQLRKLENYTFDEKLLNQTIEGIALGGHNETFMFNKFDRLKKDNIRSLIDLRNLKAKNNNNYKWADHFYDWDSLGKNSSSKSTKQDINPSDKQKENSSQKQDNAEKFIEKIESVFDNNDKIEAQDLYNHIDMWLEKTINNASYSTWFSDVVVKDFEKNKLILNVPTDFVQEWIEEQYKSDMEKIAEKLTNSKIKINIRLNK
jgi:DNA-binding HxlR family transcriptional regulator